jgi:tripartite-type tricarboxylate transporter receptor subunit TctC
VLGLATAQRIATQPDWPTVSEQGVPNFEYTVWSGLFAQKGVPGDIVRKLETDVHAILADPDVAKKFAAFGAIPANEDLKTFVERIKRETDANEAIVSKADLRVEK